jgi:hypothetical protein
MRGHCVERHNSHFIHVFYLYPHSPGNDGNVSNVKSSLVFGKVSCSDMPKGIPGWQEAAGEKTSQAKTGMADLEKFICLFAPLQWDGQGETNIFRESMGRLRKGFIPMPLAERAVFYIYVGNGKAYKSINAKHANAKWAFCFF